MERIKRKHTLIIGYIVAMLIVIFFRWFFDNYKLQSPVVLRSPIVRIKYLNPVIYETVIDLPIVELTPTPTKTPKHTDIYEKIRKLESSGGKLVGLNKYCSGLGKVNSIGYSPSTKYCFDSVEDEFQKITDWFQDKFEKGYSIANAVCLWNKGYKLDNCKYYQDFQNI